MVQRLRHLSPPLALLAVLSLLSLAARVAWLGQPCRSPCRTAADHLLVFDEAYYVNAARVIAGINPSPGAHYTGAPAGEDPNAEHPQLAKLVIAGSIELLGDGPLAWRLGSIVLGSLAILGMFALVRAAGGGEWLALGAAALMASDNLLIVHGRLATLDIYVLAAMIWGAVAYLRGRPIAAGAVIGLGAGVKLVGPYVLLVLALFEGLRLLRSRAAEPVSRAAARLGACAVSAGAVFVALLAVMDRVARPLDSAAGRPIAAGPFHHLAHMLSYAASQTSPHGPRGIASYPWQWIFDYRPIVYLNINPARPSAGLRNVHPAAHFLGLVSPPILLLAVPALLLAGASVVRDRRVARTSVRASSAALAPAGGDVAVLGLAWFLGTFLPFALLSLLWRRTSYLYYMVVVMPGLYLAVAHLVLKVRRHRKLIAVWMLSVLAAAVVTYPFTPLP